jgi:hypothetical protein
LNGSDALKTAIYLFHQRLQVTIRKGKTSNYDLVSFINESLCLDPFKATGAEELGFMWIAEILSSGYSEEDRCWMAGSIVRSLGEHFFPQPPVLPPSHVRSAWIPPLLDFLLLCEKSHMELFPLYSAGYIALRILSVNPEPADCIAMTLPVLVSTLSPAHPLQSRNLALKVFYVLVPGWFSPQIENVLDRDIDRLLLAVGDPFEHLDLPLQDGQPSVTVNDNPMIATVVLMDLTSSDLWRNHLCHSNFASCEEIVSMEEGRSTALGCMSLVAAYLWVELLHMPAEIIAAIRRPEELQCLNTAEVIIMWAWTIGVINPGDRIGWKSIQDETLRFYQTHGFRRLVTLARHITDMTGRTFHDAFLDAHYKYSPYRLGCVQRPPMIIGGSVASDLRWRIDPLVSRNCQLRSLYYLFGYDPTAQRETVAVEGADGEVPSGCPVTPVSFTDWACNYPQGSGMSNV